MAMNENQSSKCTIIEYGDAFLPARSSCMVIGTTATDALFSSLSVFVTMIAILTVFQLHNGDKLSSPGPWVS